MYSRRVEDLVVEWGQERPDLDRSSMAVIGRIERLAELLDDVFTPTLRRFGITRADFDVLATLRRSGKPYRLTPTALSRAMMISSGGTTKRLDRLEARGLLARAADPHDRRGVVVSLTQKGMRLVDDAVEAHVADERRVLAPLRPADRKTLARLLDSLLEPLE